MAFLGTKDGCAVVGHTVAHFLFRFFILVFFLISSKSFSSLKKKEKRNLSLLPSFA